MDAGEGHRRLGRPPSARHAAGVLATAGILAAAVALPARAQDAGPQVTVQFAAFSPGQLDVLPGESVTWTNAGGRTHTVTADGGAFDSGDLDPGAAYAVPFAAEGSFIYHCTLHPAMTGEVDVRRVILDTLPPAVVPAGDRVAVTGRTADAGLPLHLERSIDGTRFVPVGDVDPRPDGTWSATVVAVQTADYRASTSAGVSETRHLAVSNRRVRLRATRDGVQVTVSPADPYARVVLERYERVRFGWWPVARTRLDYVSTARLRVRRGGRLRALLVDRDGWTALATSPPLVLRRG